MSPRWSRVGREPPLGLSETRGERASVAAEEMRADVGVKKQARPCRMGEERGFR